jgi:hypothetical protein
MRLIAMPPAHGIYEAAVEIKLAATAITYWRLPGEAGVPPEFVFEGSDNVAGTEVLYPAPRRIDEGGIEAFGYRGGVIFPIRVTPADAKRPSRLVLTLHYAICDRICVPATGHAELLLPQDGDSPARAAIAAAEARVPIVLSAVAAAKEITIRTQMSQVSKGQVPKGQVSTGQVSTGQAPMGQVETEPAKPQWQLVWHGTPAAVDLFAEGPEGWVFETRKTAENTFSLAAIAAPANPAADIPVRLTRTGDTKSYEFTLPLTLPAARPQGAL